MGDGNLGSKLTMKYPNCVLLGEGAKGSTLSIAFAGKGQVQDAGAKMIHKALIHLQLSFLNPSLKWW